MVERKKHYVKVHMSLYSIRVYLYIPLDVFFAILIYETKYVRGNYKPSIQSTNTGVLMLASVWLTSAGVNGT